MKANSLTPIRSRAKRLGIAFLTLSLAGSSLFLTSCTTEEGVVAGALAGAAIGGLVGHSSEHSYRRARYDRHYGHDDYYYHGSPRRSSYRGSYYSSYGRGYADPYCYY